MTGLAFNLGFKSTRVLTGLEITHIQQDNMTYLGLYGGTNESSIKNRSKGINITPVSANQPQNWILGSNYLSSLANDLSAGVISANQTKQLDSTIFVVFNAGQESFTAGTASNTYVASLWGSNPNTYENPGRLSITLYRESSGTPYIVLKWGRGTDLSSLSCAVQYDWMTAHGPISVIGSRSASGDMALEVRVDGVVLKSAAQVTPVLIPTTTTDWRLYAGQLSSQPIADLKVYAAAAWSSYLDADSLSSELNVMSVNLAEHLSA